VCCSLCYLVQLGVIHWVLSNSPMNQYVPYNAGNALAKRAIVGLSRRALKFRSVLHCSLGPQYEREW
jgi:hypothetical protein